MNFLPMISEINREEEELRCIQQAQSRCDFSEFAQQPEAAALGPQLGRGGKGGRIAEAGGQSSKVGETLAPPKRGVWMDRLWHI